MDGLIESTCLGFDVVKRGWADNAEADQEDVGLGI